ncbi:MAG: hypothetical protein IKN53_05990, partial [Oscillibacter sp.]|nr:hypothetical protein [Oscillibacter sp.]
ITGSTSAWISINRTAAQHELQIVSDSADLMLADVNIYRSIWNESTNQYEYRDVTMQPFQLNDYDAIFNMNEYSPAYIRIHLTGDALHAGNEILFTLYRQNTSPEPNGTATTQNGLYEGNTDAIAAYLSNIVEARLAAIPSLNNATDPAVIYPAANSSSIVWSNADYLATPGKSAQGRSIITAKSPQTTGLRYTMTQEGEATVFLRLDYCEDLVMAYLNTHRNDFAVTRLDKTLVFEFTGDLAQILVQLL